ncbi:SDR family oxidoreductase [Novosphingobium sp. 9U]|uniref:SDR family oxidoreductase n=1 Tax=Novosphingobium sp. 9U TaxID=2653158 RepID=UPI0012F426CD|nr:SDR family oxidoreductase [Novosphingobium sp. 9U]VWX49440.1 dTDP-4-dehydrorhamnose reductase [Novosphingobium sp. 9U]
MSNLELWAGAECTVNRTGDDYKDQLILTGHHDRLDDLAALAPLGVKALRFPVLWERVAPDPQHLPDWSWSDHGLGLLQEHGIRPIVGLVHHGSGPRHTSLIEQSFVEGLAAHALSVAGRYPWVQDWTPVNEPLTTARFSALYGIWYPHARDERTFWAALITQIEATRAAMKAVRSINPAARLIQTDDLGRTYATAALAEQAGFDNVRRWMGWDLLCGRVDRTHEFWVRLCDYGFESRLRSLVDDPCPPDVIGVNHYLTSDRFLDHRLKRYPAHTHGQNDWQGFADVEAVRVLEPPTGGLRGALAEAWQRYQIPLAATEVHNGCSREEQLRWFAEAWRTAGELRGCGVDVRAVTAWALYGNTGWNTLLTARGLYEAGAYDMRSGQPRETAMGHLLAAVGTGGEPPALAQGAGWWRRPARLCHPVVNRPAALRAHLGAEIKGDKRRPLLILGATGTLGQALARACAQRDLACLTTGRQQLNLDDSSSIEAALERHQPWAVVNAAGWVRVDDAEDEREPCMRANAEGATALARACAAREIATVNVSSDLVFGDAAQQSYCESDQPAPLSVYGDSKLRMESAVAALAGEHLVIRTAAFFSPHDPYNFAMAVVDHLRRGTRFAAAADYMISPTYVPDLCDAALDLLIDRETGIWHLSNEAAVSWAEFATQVARACGLDARLIDPVPGMQLGWRARRPRASALVSVKGAAMPSLSSAIERFAHALA